MTKSKTTNQSTPKNKTKTNFSVSLAICIYLTQISQSNHPAGCAEQLPPRG